MVNGGLGSKRSHRVIEREGVAYSSIWHSLREGKREAEVYQSTPSLAWCYRYLSLWFPTPSWLFLPCIWWFHLFLTRVTAHPHLSPQNYSIWILYGGHAHHTSPFPDTNEEKRSKKKEKRINEPRWSFEPNPLFLSLFLFVPPEIESTFPFSHLTK